MNFFKYIFLILGFLCIMYAKINYTERVSILSNEKSPYTKKEKICLYSGYFLLGIAVLLTILKN